MMNRVIIETYLRSIYFSGESYKLFFSVGNDDDIQSKLQNRLINLYIVNIYISVQVLCTK